MTPHHKILLLLLPIFLWWSNIVWGSQLVLFPRDRLAFEWGLISELWIFEFSIVRLLIFLGIRMSCLIGGWISFCDRSTHRLTIVLWSHLIFSWPPIGISNRTHLLIFSSWSRIMSSSGNKESDSVWRSRKPSLVDCCRQERDKRADNKHRVCMLIIKLIMMMMNLYLQQCV